MTEFLAFAVFLITLFFVIKQPWKIGIGWSATVGAIVSLTLGIVSIDDVKRVVEIVWDPTVAFLGIIFISIILDKIGFFEWASLHMMHFANGDGKKLFLYIIILGAIISAFFANDGAALILTPIVYQKIKHLGLKEKAMLPFIMGSGFVADTTSLPLIISNLVNILTADYFHIGFFEYALRMVFVNLFSLVATITVLYLFFKKDLINRYDTEILEDKPPKLAIKDPFVFKITWFVAFGMLIAFFISEIYHHIPASFIIVAASVILFLASLKNKVFDTKTVLLKETPWKIVVFSIGMYVVVYGLKNAGLTVELSRLIEISLNYGEFVAIFFTGFLAAFLSSVMNNMPSVMIVNLSIDEINTALEVKKILGYANVIGCDLGPKITPIGSLATLLWLHILESKGIKIGWGYYFKIGIVLTIPTLIFTLLGLYIVIKIFG
ncbi:MAG: arsenic transporter [Hydrogenothermaceae bacterium]|nr:arsenic transporter [Hydrogenothermaceae bacterium]